MVLKRDRTTMDERVVDTPEQTLDRMVDDILSSDEIALAEEVQYF
jgi:hypothetical protein